MSDLPDAPTPTRIERIRSAIATPQAIYGTLLICALIGSATDDDYDREVLVLVLRTTIVFWLAHVFADGIAYYGRHREEVSARDALQYGIHHGAGLLYAAVIPSLCLLLGAFGLVDEYVAYYIGLIVPVFLLAALGWIALGNRHVRWYLRLGGAAITAALGVIVILVKIIAH